MAQLLHGCARTTEATRREIQHSKESAEKVAKKLGINRKTVLKWRKRDYTHDTPMGPKNPRSTVLTIEEEAMIVAFRKKTLLPLDDCLYSLQETIPRLTRSSLHRCLKRHGISKLPQKDEKKVYAKQPFKKYRQGYIHIDITVVRTQEGRAYLFCAIDRTNKFVFAQVYKDQTTATSKAFLQQLIERIPYKINIILTDNGIQFTYSKRVKYAANHPFDVICRKHHIEHRLIQVGHPWTNGQVERMNKTIKEATVKKYHYLSHEQFKEHLRLFLEAYNFAKRLKALKGKTPYEELVDFWEENPAYFKFEPNHYNMGLYITGFRACDVFV